MHFVYMTMSYYEGIFGKKPEYNIQLVLSNDTRTFELNDVPERYTKNVAQKTAN
ncbi:hypothetical protein YSY43_16090 [Paenibacillus sp. YSY-4.3]